MRLRIYFLLIALLGSLLVSADEPDSAWIFIYATDKNNNTNGLHYAWSSDGENFHPIGPEFRFLFSDFGTWGSQKKLIDPFIVRDEKGWFHCLWTLNDEVGQLAHATTNDLFNWKSQSYPQMMEQGNVKEIEAISDGSSTIITWKSEFNGEEKLYKTSTSDFKNYSPSLPALPSDRHQLRRNVLLNGHKQEGTVFNVEWNLIEQLIKHYEWEQFHNQERTETTRQDAERFKNLKPVDAEFVLLPEHSKEISTELIGVFFEDINYAADGGIYAELVQNRGFEYSPADRRGNDPNWHSKTAWSTVGQPAVFEIDTLNPVHENQKHYARVQTDGKGSGISNSGFDGIVIRKGEKYDFSLFAKKLNSNSNTLLIRLIGQDEALLGESTIKNIGNKWEKYETVITAKAGDGMAQVQVIPQAEGELALDLISLFPQNTFKGRKNGLRPDLAQVIADLHPRFVRFPGGCVAHGDGLNNMYRWKNTVGPIETRKTQPNIWRYHQSAGLGYFEYFQFCEDLGAEALPVLPAGVPCQNSSCGGHGQQGGIPLCEMDDYVQEVLDLIEWANGDKNTKWGKVRAEAGHPEPFNLKYLGIGNEDLITDIFKERFTMIFTAVKEKHPEITVIGTVGPFYRGSDYEEGWELATQLGVPMVDEHYYQPPGWFINNQDFYDKYDRSKAKVYLGEYAAHLPGRPMNIETALSEALYLTAIERNGDVVHMTSFAPLLAKEGHTQWNPDLIYFNNTEVKPTVDYYVQKLFGQNSGDRYLPTHKFLSESRKEVDRRIAISTVVDSKSRHLIIKLVNLLPVEVNSKIDLNGLLTAEKDAVLHVLQGDPADRNATPTESWLKLSEHFNYTLPAYSFSVIRVQLD